MLKAEAEDDADVAEPFYMIDNAKFEMVNSKYAMTTICNILMNLVVLENKFVEEAHIFFHLLKFIMDTLPSLENNGEVGNTCRFKDLRVTFCFLGFGIVWKFGCSRATNSTETYKATQIY